MKCVICNKEINGFGNNPWPIRGYGRCCDSCNSRVLMSRLALMLINEH